MKNWPAGGISPQQVDRNPVKPPIEPNFIEIGQTSLEKSAKKSYLFGPSRHFFCHGQKRDYLSRASQRARGATKNKSWRMTAILKMEKKTSDCLKKQTLLGLQFVTLMHIGSRKQWNIKI